MDIILPCRSHKFSIKIPSEELKRGPLLVRCPDCKDRYLVKKNGEIELVDQGPLVRKFLAMHY